MKKLLFALSIFVLTVTSGFGITYNVNFDNDASGNSIASNAVISSQYASWGISFLANPFTGGFWATNTSLEVGSVAAGTLGLGADASMGNVLHSYPGYFAENGDPSFRVNLPGGTSSVQADFIGDHDGESILLAFSSAGTVLGSQFATPGYGAVKTLSVSSSTPIAYAILVPGTYNDWVGVDNLRVTAVPEPGSFLILGLGFLLIRRRTS